MKHLPNAVTLLNLFLGSVAIVLAINGRPHYAAIIIAFCSVLDFADGMLARLLNARSELGQQLDSLADLVSFGLAPSAIMYYYLQGAAPTINHSSPSNCFAICRLFGGHLCRPAPGHI
jgi:CDP-diacylglycerol---serine O-phosphatidyltransferase